MADTFRLAGKLAGIFFVITIFTLISLTILLGIDINLPLRIVAGLVFVVFELGFIWDNCMRWGEKDCRAVITYVRNRGTKEQLKEAKGQLFYPAKGFVAAAIVMLIPFVLTVIYTVMAYRGWENGMGDTADKIYTVLFFMFEGYTPALAAATTVCTTMTAMPGMAPIATLGLDVVALGRFNDISTPNMVLPFMFFIPIVLFVVFAGVCYIMGFKKRCLEVPEHMRRVYFPKDGKFTPMNDPDKTVLNGEQADTQAQEGSTR